MAGIFEQHETAESGRGTRVWFAVCDLTKQFTPYNVPSELTFFLIPHQPSNPRNKQ